MTSKPRLLDLYCGAGGAAMGYARAGFEVVGVDIKPQPRYPFEFIQADATTFSLDGFDVVHASPPCQEYTPLRARQNGRHYPDLIASTRELLELAKVPWVIENVPNSPLRHYITLCGNSFGLRTYRHRRFETSWLMFQPEHRSHTVATSTKKRRKDFDAGMNISITGDVGSWLGPACMGIDWMTGNELSQAIPPAYTEYIGKQLMAHLEARH